MFKIYDPNQFNSLPEFELASTRPAAVIQLARVCGQVLCRYGCQELLAICLLHKHFDLEPHERLVRVFDDRKTAHAIPVAAEAAPDALPWVWRYGEGSAARGWYPVEYVQASPSARGLNTLIQHCDQVLDELGRVLVAHQLEDVFGVAALYAGDGLDVDDHEHTVETSSVRPRRLNLTVSSRGESDSSADATVTLFRWTGEMQ